MLAHKQAVAAAALKLEELFRLSGAGCPAESGFGAIPRQADDGLGFTCWGSGAGEKNKPKRKWKTSRSFWRSRRQGVGENEGKERLRRYIAI